MKFFSNFDTNIRSKSVAEQVEKYGQENVLCFGRSRLYWAIKIFIPMLFWVSISLGAVVLFYYFFETQYILFFVILVLVLSMFFLIPIVGKWINYELDFIIVTPDFLMMHDQAGIFKKKVITVNEKSIKTISVERLGLLYSIFNNGDIIVLSEGDVSHGEITLKWIPKPEKRKNQIAKILDKDWVNE